MGYVGDGPKPQLEVGDISTKDVTATGDLTVDTDTLFVDSTNNRVLVGNTSSIGTVVAGKIQTTGIQSFITTNNEVGGFIGVNSNADNSLAIGADPDSDRAGSHIVFYVDGFSEKMRIDSSGNVLVGTTSQIEGSKVCISATNGLGVNVTGAGGGALNANYVSTGTGYFGYFKYNGAVVGSITSSGSSTAYNTTSDHRLKENVTGITDGIERVKQLNPSRFNFIADADTTVDGFLAHEAATVVPEAVTGEKDAMRDEEYEVTPAVLDDDGNVVTEAVMGTRSVPDYQGIDQAKLVPLLTAALQEAVAKIETLEAKVTALENA